ncbi:MAG: GNAT family N-acetyltransferase, partial [Candidatus Zixiibacteriota bacterium]
MPEISLMTEADIPFAVKLAQVEQWGNCDADYRRLLLFEPDGCFIAREKGKSVGIITTISYGDYAFLASLIVVKQKRGRGIGAELIKRAIYYLHAKGIDNIELDSEIRAVPLYRRMAFKDKYLSLRFLRPAQNSCIAKSLVPPRPAVGRIVAFDHDLTGINRERVIRRFCEEFADSVFVVGEKEISAYAVVRPGDGGLCHIGPAVGRGCDSLNVLLDRIIQRFPDCALKIGVPELS